MEHMYIHIPFCHSICSYCDFPKMLYQDEIIMDYLKSLEQEINDFYNNEVMKTVYIGGGTPTCLNKEELTYLFKILKIVKKDSLIEYTMECNPEDITDELITILKNNGINRISIGIESFNENNLKLLNRNNNFNDIKEKVDLIRKHGINNINLDLMYALPGSNMDTLKKDLKLILKLEPTHISTYSLIIENNTKLKIDNVKNIDEDLDFKMYEYICKKLTKKGFIHYEVSNFGKKEYQGVHNLAYWNNEEYYGFGLGASGYMHGFRYDNTKNMTKYLKGMYHSSESLLSKKEIMDYEVMLGLRKMSGINLDDFYQKYHINLQNAYPIKPLIKSGELTYKNGNVYISPSYIYVMNEILLKLV